MRETRYGPVGVLPDLHENNTGVKSVEDEERQRNPGDNSPGQQSEELSLNALRDVAVGHEGVQDPEGDVGEQHEGDDLPAGLGLLLGPGGADPPAGLADDHTWVGEVVSPVQSRQDTQESLLWNETWMRSSEHCMNTSTLGMSSVPNGSMVTMEERMPKMA